MPSAVPWGRTDVGSASAPEPDLAACNKEADLRALVTGRAGFVGSTLVDRLIAEGHEVTVVDDLSRGNMRNPHEASDRISFVRADVQDADLIDVMAKAQPEVGFHLAAQIDVRESVVDPAPDARINILGTINVAEAARAVGVRKIVFTCRAARSTAPPPTCRCPRRHPSTRCRRMRCQRCQASSTSTRWDRRRYNIGTAVPTSDQQHTLIARVCGAEDHPEYAAARLGGLRNSAIDPSRAGRELGWTPVVDLRTGVSASIDFFRRHR